MTGYFNETFLAGYSPFGFPCLFLGNNLVAMSTQKTQTRITERTSPIKTEGQGNPEVPIGALTLAKWGFKVLCHNGPQKPQGPCKGPPRHKGLPTIRMIP